MANARLAMRLCSRGFPFGNVIAVDRHTEHVRRYKAKLLCVEGDDADDRAIDGGDDPTLPHPAAN